MAPKKIIQAVSIVLLLSSTIIENSLAYCLASQVIINPLSTQVPLCQNLPKLSYANIGFSAISTAINAGIQTATGQKDPDTGKPIDYFKSIYDTYTKNALTFLGSGSNDAWQQSAYMSQIQDFSKIAQDKGLVSALNTYGTGFFNAVAVNEMTKTGISIGDYLYNKLDELAYVNKTIDGTTYAAVDIKDDGTSDILAEALFQQKQKSDGSGFFWDFAGLKDITKDGYTLGYGQLGVDAYGKLGYTDAKIYTTFNSDVQYQQIVNGQQSYAEIKDSTGKTLLIIEPTDGGHYNVYDSYGKYVDAVINNNLDGYSVSLKDGVLDFPDAKYINFIGLSTGERENLKTKFNVTDQQLDEMLNMMRQAVGNESGVNGPNLFVTPAFADEIVGYQKNNLDQIANSIKTNNPTVWQELGGWFEGVGYNISHASDYIASHYFGKSDPVVINRVYSRIVDENIQFYNGTSYPGEVSLTIDQNQQFYENQWGDSKWYTDDQAVVVRYQDKWAVFGEKFFNALVNEQDSLDLMSVEYRDALGNRLSDRFKDPNARVQVEKYFSVMEFANAWQQGVEGFTGGDGVYHIAVERYGSFVSKPTDQKRWLGYVEDTDTGEKIPIENKELLLDLIGRSRGN